MDMGRPSRERLPGRWPDGLLYDMFQVLRLLLEAVAEVRKQELKRLSGTLKGLLSGMESFLPARRSKRVEALNWKRLGCFPSRRKSLLMGFWPIVTGNFPRNTLSQATRSP